MVFNQKSVKEPKAGPFGPVLTIQRLLVLHEFAEGFKAALAVLQSLGSTRELDRDVAVTEKWREDSDPFNFI
jgi:hypothetical protein